ncbi:MAG: putative baseplate assembly protein, partial [Chroococcales cyanobacterium]
FYLYPFIQSIRFSFSELKRKGGNPLEGAEVRLHLPKSFPVTQFNTYQGRWLRCVYETPELTQPAYSRSPRIVGLSVRSIGGTSEAYQCTTIRHEIVGESNGKPGQTFQLQSTPVMPRTEEEYLLVTPPGGLPQIWQEVSDFANSTPSDLHYTIDSLTGMVQFGPLIREPGQLKESTKLRARSQGFSGGTFINPNTHDVRESLERQYGAIPPRGSTIQMVAYRTGGGRKGNVQARTISILKSAVPYVASVTNHTPARNGADVESLDDAVIRVPRLLRTRDRAVTAEDFETLAIEAGQGAIARAVCLQATRPQDAGIVRLIVVPQVNLNGISQRVGLAPEQFALNEQLQAQILTYLDERRLLGVQVQCHEPEYVGVSVQTEVALEPEYNNPRAQQQILWELEIRLYRFLNPITGGFNGDGWSFGRPVYSSDIVTLFQNLPGVRYLGAVQLFELRRVGDNWIRTLPKEPVVDPGIFGLICSWRNDQLRSGHIISLI